jgi:protein involved in polysaccharide export with SLBB domain
MSTIEEMRAAWDKQTKEPLVPMPPGAAVPGSALEYRIAKLRLEPGDVLIVKVDQHLTLEMTIGAAQAMKDIVGQDVPVMVIDRDIDVSLLTKAEIAERTV